MIYWKFKYSRTQRALAVGVSELVQLILSLACGIIFWSEVIGKALVIVTTLIIAGIIYRAGKMKGEKNE